MESLTFEQLPKTTYQLLNEIREVKALLNKVVRNQPEPDNPISIKDVSDLTGLSIPTLYGRCQRNEIPYSKKGNRLYFFKSNIIDWIKSGRQKTVTEIKSDVDDCLSKQKNLEEWR